MNTQKIRIKKLHHDAQLPKRSTELAGGWDIFCTEVVWGYETDIVICKTGLAMQPVDPNYKITLVPRSSLTNTNWILQNSPALGDPDYPGEYEFRFRAMPIGVIADDGNSWGYELVYPSSPYSPGERIGQMYLEEIIPIEFEEVEEMVVTDRKGGFGSTGK